MLPVQRTSPSLIHSELHANDPCSSRPFQQCLGPFWNRCSFSDCCNLEEVFCRDDIHATLEEGHHETWFQGLISKLHRSQHESVKMGSDNVSVIWMEVNDDI